MGWQLKEEGTSGMTWLERHNTRLIHNKRANEHKETLFHFAGSVRDFAH